MRNDFGLFGSTKSAQVRTRAGQNRRRKKNKLTLLYSALIKKNSYAKFKVLRLMVTRYVGNMIAFLRCHYAYLSITITSKLSALNHNKILYYCNCHANDLQQRPHVRSLFFGSCENKLRHCKRSCDLRCIIPGIA